MNSIRAPHRSAKNPALSGVTYPSFVLAKTIVLNGSRVRGMGENPVGPFG